MSLIVEIISWLVNLVQSLGYLGIFIGMTIESSIIPFPAELILPPAGVLVANGEMSFVIVLALAIAGSIAGALVNYYLAYHLGRRAINKLLLKYGKVFFIKQDELIKSENAFHRHGEITTLFGRLIPGIRSFVSLPAGFYKMNVGRFCFFTGLGAGIWSAILIYVGIIYGNNKENIDSFLGSATIVMLIAIVIIILAYIYLKRSNRNLNSVDKSLKL